jgi:hypothetical protein
MLMPWTSGPNSPCLVEVPLMSKSDAETKMVHVLRLGAANGPDMYWGKL